MSSELAVIHPQTMELSVTDVQNQVAKIQELMTNLMKDGEHYGVIPGTQKPSLFKSGAEKIGFIFRLAPEYAVERDDLPGGHREYRVICILRHMNTGLQVGQGVGSCSTMESKYRWRNQSVTEEAGPVPKGYWEADKADAKARAKILEAAYGPGRYQTKKKDGAWVVLKVTGDGERTENPDIADLYNTVLKMAKKRAYVDATITATAASDFFTQDVEDFAAKGAETASKPAPPAAKAQPDKPARPQAPAEGSAASRRQEVIAFIDANAPKLTPGQLSELRKQLVSAGTTPILLDAVGAKAQEFLALNYGWDEEGPQEAQPSFQDETQEVYY